MTNYTTVGLCVSGGFGGSVGGGTELKFTNENELALLQSSPWLSQRIRWTGKRGSHAEPALPPLARAHDVIVLIIEFFVLHREDLQLLSTHIAGRVATQLPSPKSK